MALGSQIFTDQDVINLKRFRVLRGPEDCAFTRSGEPSHFQKSLFALDNRLPAKNEYALHQLRKKPLSYQDSDQGNQREAIFLAFLGVPLVLGIVTSLAIL